MSSSPLRPGADQKEQLDWYKAQYAQLEADLADFQASSKELEEQLEKDVETAEKSERKWKEQVEKLNFEVEEWKTKHKQAKTEANSAQNALQKEITKMRQEHRDLQLKLRDTEVMNDDYERQARNTETSLEDMESKYSAAIERGVLLDETVKQGEQEREELRIETQRLRDELGDLKVENEITLEKLRLSEETAEGLRARKPSSMAVEHLRARSPASEASGMTPLSPTASTPPPKSDTASDAQTPPSPPLSDVPAGNRADQKTPMAAKRKSVNPESATPRPLSYGARQAPRHSRGPSVASSVSVSTARSDAKAMKPPLSKPRAPSRPSNAADNKLPRSDSLYQIRGLIGRMQKIEERVQNARSKLPAPSSTPRGSPRTGAASNDGVPSSVTMRRSSKRPSMSRTSSIIDGDNSIMEEGTPSATPGGGGMGHAKRLSYGLPRPTSQATSRSEMPDRPPSALERPTSALAPRPGSRTSFAAPTHRPASRSGARTDLGQYSSGRSSTNASSRPRSSIGGSYAGGGAAHGHRPSMSMTDMRETATEESADAVVAAPPSSRRTTLERSGIPTPFSSSNAARATRVPGSSRISAHQTSSARDGEEEAEAMQLPPSRRRTSDVGETY